MSQDLSTEHTRGARPVADAPVDALIALADELARRWTIALIGARPLAQMTDVPLEELAREAPELCAQVARALAADAELAGLRERVVQPGLRPGAGAPPSGSLTALAGFAGDARSVIQDLEALRGVMWEATLGALPDVTARQVADLSDRLALVCATLLGTLLASYAPPGAPVASTSPSPAAVPGRARVPTGSPQGSPSGQRAVLIDEREEAPAAAGASPGPSAAADRSPPPSGQHGPPVDAAPRAEPAQTAPRARPWDTPLGARGEPERLRLRDGEQHAPNRADCVDPVMRITRAPRLPVDGRP